MVFAGQVSDRVGPRRVLGIGLALVALACFAAASTRAEHVGELRWLNSRGELFSSASYYGVTTRRP